MRDLNEHFSLMKKTWPSTLVARSEVGRFSGGVISPPYLANLDSKGEGPAERIRVGRKICYPVNALVDWLKERSTVLESKKSALD
jgi:hypothetical protein